jgi:Type II CAAX prenyl endopeptidase Rce1-like
MIEELLFRAIVQKWLTRFADPRGSSASPAKNQPCADLAGDDFAAQMDVQLAKSGEAMRIDQQPLLEPAGSEPRSSVAIVSTSLLFAAMHAAQWPAPIAIFVLAVALGALYQRTGSLIAAIAMHGTFNGFSTLLLLLEALSRQIEPNQAVQQAAPVAGFFSYLLPWI